MNNKKANILKVSVLLLLLGAIYPGFAVASPDSFSNQQTLEPYKIATPMSGNTSTAETEKNSVLGTTTELGVPFSTLWLLAAGLVGFVVMSQRRGI